jgi:hypothetical protein
LRFFEVFQSFQQVCAHLLHLLTFVLFFVFYPPGNPFFQICFLSIKFSPNSPVRLHHLIKNIIRPIFGRSSWSPFEKKKKFRLIPLDPTWSHHSPGHLFLQIYVYNLEFSFTIYKKNAKFHLKFFIFDNFMGRTLKKNKTGKANSMSSKTPNYLT